MLRRALLDIFTSIDATPGDVRVTCVYFLPERWQPLNKLKGLSDHRSIEVQTPVLALTSNRSEIARNKNGAFLRELKR